MASIAWQQFLARPSLELPSPEILNTLSSAPILITGAGGSIGSALVLRLAALAPASLILLESAENSLYRLQRALGGCGATVNTTLILGDAGDRALMEDIFAVHAPGTVFHAAAYKHVPLLEEQPLAAIENNIFVTETVAAVSAAYGARLVLLSTDKTVEPVSVMGATKRVAEDIVLACSGIVLRLGNVLASSGSVAEVFADEIARGGPLTVTDPASRRYLLTMEEAVNLLLIAATHPALPALLVPELLLPHGILDLARFMARELAPDREIPIRITGLRPGDKVVERLWSSSDRIYPAGIDGLVSVQSDRSTPTRLKHGLAALRAAVKGRDLSAAFAQLRLLVPDFQPGPAALASMRTRPTSLRKNAGSLRHSKADACNRPRRIGVVTTSRADYSHLYWPLRELASHPAIELGIFALGPHLSPEFGNTIQQIERDGFAIQARIECLLSSDSDIGMAKTIGLAVIGLADALTAWRPDLLLLIADRYEMLAPAAAAVALRIPIAHIEGGEISQGAIDDQVRNALTKLAHIHFTSTENARRRVISMGEESWRVHWAGAPSLDHLRRSTLLDRAALESRLGFALKPPVLVAAWHPVTILRDTNAEAEDFFSALAKAPGQLLFVYPNADAGSHALIERAKALAATRSDTHVIVNLDAATYFSLLGHADLLVGNSSSGIMEAASFALPVVNVGMRQQGRERACNVLDAPAEAAAIHAAIERALSREFRRSLVGMTNPYGDGTAAVTIVSVLASVPLEDLLIKQPALLPEATELQTERQ